MCPEGGHDSMSPHAQREVSFHVMTSYASMCAHALLCRYRGHDGPIFDVGLGVGGDLDWLGMMRA